MNYLQTHIICPVDINNNTVNFTNTNLTVVSKSLSHYLKDSKEAIILAATLGLEADRRIETLQNISLSKTVEFDNECLDYIENEIDKTVQEIEALNNFSTKPRYSPGFGDFSLNYQSQILDILKTKTKIGLTCTKENYMIPTKSVTAIIGVK